MPDGDNITVHSADGKIHIFPAGTDPSIIDGAMKRYVQSKTNQTAQTNVSRYKTSPEESTLKKVVRGGALGAFSGAGIAETPTPVTDTLQGLKDQASTALVKPYKERSLESVKNALAANPAVTVPTSLATGFGNVAQDVNPSIDNFFRWLSNVTGGKKYDYKSTDPEQTSHDVTSMAVQTALLKGGKSAVADPLGKGRVAAVGREVMNEGASKVKVLNDLHAHAIETQKHLAGVADAVHQDAQQAMSAVSQAVDSAKPEGVFDKGEVSNRLKTAIGDTLSDTTQLPKSVQKLLPAEKAGTQAGPNIGGKVLDLSKPEDAAAYQKYKASGAFTPEEVARYEGKSTGQMSFEDLKQARSDLGRQMQNLQGPAKSAASAAYKELSTMLREGARDAGVEPDWIDANARWKNYLDDFERSPIKKSLFGENASDIMEPLTGKSRIQVGQILQKYTPFGLDIDKLNQEVSRYGVADTVMKLSKPGKMDLLLARLSPSAVALRQIGPRIMRNPSVFSAVGGEGFEPQNISPSKVFPSQKIAAKATSRGIPQGNPTPFKGGINASGLEASTQPVSTARAIDSLSSEIDTMKSKLRGNAPASEKAALQKQIDDYQQRLDDLRKK